jgi:hypothetical protein
MAAQAITFFSAGNDSSSITLSFAFYELALHKEVQDRLRREIRATLDKEKDLTYESIHNIKYLDMVLSGKVSTAIFSITVKSFQSRGVKKISFDGSHKSTTFRKLHI